MELPEIAQLAIGIFSLIGAAIGTVIMFIGTFALGIGSIIQVLGPFIAAISNAVLALFVHLGGWSGISSLISQAIAIIITAVQGLSAVFFAVAAVVVAVLVGIYLAWTENFMHIHQWMSWFWEGIMQMFDGAINVILGIIDFFVAMFTGDLKGMGSALNRIFYGFVNLFFGYMRSAVGFFATIGAGVLKLVDLVIDSLDWLANQIFHWIDDTFGTAFSNMYQWGKDVIQAFINGITSMAHIAQDTLGGIVSGSIDFVGGMVGGGKALDDFIWRPGSPPARISPADTVVGTKGEGMGGNITNNFYGFTMDDLRIELDRRDRRIVEDVRRRVSV